MMSVIGLMLALVCRPPTKPPMSCEYYSLLGCAYEFSSEFSTGMFSFGEPKEPCPGTQEPRKIREAPNEDCSALAPNHFPPDYEPPARLVAGRPVGTEEFRETWLRLQDFKPQAQSKITQWLRFWDAVKAIPFRYADYVEVPQVAPIYQIRPRGAEFEQRQFDFAAAQRGAIPNKFRTNKACCIKTEFFVKETYQRQRGCLGRVRVRDGDWLQVETPQSLELLGALSLLPDDVDLQLPPCFVHTPALAQVSALVWVRARDTKALRVIERPLHSERKLREIPFFPPESRIWLFIFYVHQAWTKPLWVSAFDFAAIRNCGYGCRHGTECLDYRSRSCYRPFVRTSAQTGWLPPGTVLESPDGSRAGMTIGYQHLGPQWSYTPERACYELAESPPHEGPNLPTALLHAATQYRSRLSCTDEGLRTNQCSPEQAVGVLAGSKRRATLVVCVRPEQVVGTVERAPTALHRHALAPTGVAPCGLWKLPALAGALE